MNEKQQIEISEHDYKSVKLMTKGYKDIEKSLFHIVSYINNSWCVVQIVDVNKQQGLFIADVIVKLRAKTRRQAENALSSARDLMIAAGYKLK